MSKLKLALSNPKVIDAMVARIQRMTPEEALAFLTYRTPGIEETDMTGMFSDRPAPKRTVRSKRRDVSA